MSFAGASPFMMTPVTGKPYSAERAMETVQTLADGTHIKQTMMTEKIYRDSAGRTRTERQMQIPRMGSANPPEVPTMIEITDPVAHVHYSFNTQSKTVSRQEMAAPPMPAGSTFIGQNGQISQPAMPRISLAPPAQMPRGNMPNDPLRPQFKMEKLDPQTIEGIAVEGRRTTTTYPVGAIGNDREIVTTNEMWTSPELGVMVLSKNSDPRNGEQTQKLSNISRDDPDPSLFQPPAGYEIVDQKNQPSGNMLFAPPPPPPPGK